MSSALLQQISLVDSLAQSHLLKPDSELEHALSNSKAKGLPPISVSKLHGQFLSIQCQLINAKSVLEVGTLGGYSTLWFAKAGAKVTSIEIDPKNRQVALENTKAHRDQVDIILGSALDVMPKLIDEGQKFDFVFIDASWEHQADFFHMAVPLTRKGGCIYVDNVVRELFETERFDEKETLLTKVGKETGIQATLISTTSSHKGVVEEMVDGFLMAIVD